ncbi:MAG: Metalloprotease TldD [Candidatus Dichloromethanomonas elyunquensis]|nr:MAG: Metalloprotease TldD [Candidatus Dichloromethanomonas elyunquensis]
MDSGKIREIVKDIAGQPYPGYVIMRAQARREITIKLCNGKIENVFTGNESGMGVQAFTANGASGFSSANTIDRKMAEELVQKATALARESERIGCELNQQIFSFPPHYDALPNGVQYPFDQFTPQELQDMLAFIHDQLKKIHLADTGIAWQTSYKQIEDYWCIGRTDGTLVSFFIPRAVLLHQGTVRQGDAGQSFSVHLSGVDAGILLQEKRDGLLYRQAVDKANFISKVRTADQIPSGSYPIIIDYGLAKGLAHEAFGHAVESDLAEESVLSQNGKLQIGLMVSNHGVDITDGSLKGDWAYQPYSANGEKRENVTIVEDGILKQGLGDVFSAEKAGMAMTGAGRAESYGSIPLPRMTNIRLVTKKHIPLPESETLENELRNMRDVLIREGLLEIGHHYVLVGYRGGQVNIKTGDFVFQCDGAVNIADPALTVYRPGIFSGKILSVLGSVRLSTGQERYDAIGTCGKAGQSIPSSGGGSGYIFIEKNEHIRLGGNESDR